MYVRSQRFMYSQRRDFRSSHLYAVTTPTLLFRNVEAYNNLFYAAYSLFLDLVDAAFNGPAAAGHVLKGMEGFLPSPTCFSCFYSICLYFDLTQMLITCF